MSSPAPLPPVAIAVAPNGGRRTKADHPALPITPAELATCAAECLEAGAAMIHVHVRDRDGRHLLDADAYRAATEAIRAAVGEQMVLQVTSESLGYYEPAAQAAVVRELRPEAVSLALREFLRGPEDEGDFAALLTWLKEAEVLPQIILFAPEEMAQLQALFQRGLIPWDDVPILYAIGRYKTGQTATPEELVPFLEMPQPCHWMACAFGQQEASVLTAAALMGGHVRTGFENNFALPDGSMAASNADLVRAVARPLTALGRQIETGEALRERWRQLAA